MRPARSASRSRAGSSRSARCARMRARRRRAVDAGAGQSALCAAGARPARRRHAARGSHPHAHRADAGREDAPAARPRCAGPLGAAHRHRVHRLVRPSARATSYSRRGQHAGRAAGARGNARQPTSAARICRSPSACSRRWRPATRPAATSAASRPRRCSSTRPRTIRSSTCASTITRSRSSTAPAVREEPRALPAVPRVPAEPCAAGGHHRPRGDRGGDRALPGRAQDVRRHCSKCATCARTSPSRTASSPRSTA